MDILLILTYNIFIQQCLMTNFKLISDSLVKIKNPRKIGNSKRGTLIVHSVFYTGARMVLEAGPFRKSRGNQVTHSTHG